MRDRWIGAWVLLGFALRVAFALLYWHGQPLTQDEREYLALGRSIARGEGVRYPADEPVPGTGQRIGRAPGYPLFLATLRVTVPVEHAPRRVQLAQCALGAGGIWLIAAFAHRGGGPRAARAAAAIAAVYPPLVVMPAYVFSETLYSSLALAAALLLDRDALPPGRGGPSASAGAGAVLTGLAALTRPAILLFVPLWSAWLAMRRGPAAAAVFALTVTLCVAPWTVRNHRVYGRWMAIASEGGVTFWTGNHPLASGDGDLAANVRLKAADLAFRAGHAALTAEQLEPLYYRDALAWIGGHPRAWLALEAKKAFYTVVPAGASYALHSARYRIATTVPYLLLVPLAAAGAWRARARDRGAPPQALWLMAAATVLTSLVFFPQERFRLPIIDPALIVAAALIRA